MTTHARALAALLLLCASGCAAQSADLPPRTLAVTLGARRFHLELALDDDSRYHGLSDRKQIAADGGMLFVYDAPRDLNFVMRKCYVPIDLLYLGPGGQIVSMHHMAVVPYDTPEADLQLYSSGWPAQFVVEVKDGTIDELGLKLGQKIDLPIEDLKRWAK